ncbi:hypothetical protein EVAR_2223_1 [Eumeta japonica]|uniref:Uncharacterized protein n=1 Tax=Eumeta variegata TaxID=151549 RepID=A0A4C1SHP2_EUMVA|nr:hypothetical protein EVAR_2223_1 [Eumeta japonica]
MRINKVSPQLSVLFVSARIPCRRRRTQPVSAGEIIGIAADTELSPSADGKVTKAKPKKNGQTTPTERKLLIDQRAECHAAAALDRAPPSEL